jgi:hypothetical protein
MWSVTVLTTDCLYHGIFLVSCILGKLHCHRIIQKAFWLRSWVQNLDNLTGVATRRGKANTSRRKISWKYCTLSQINSFHLEIGTVNLLTVQGWWTYFNCGERLLQSQAMEMVISCNKKWKELCPWMGWQHVPPTRLNSKKSRQPCYHWEKRKSYSVSYLYLTKKFPIHDKVKKKTKGSNQYHHLYVINMSRICYNFILLYF